MSNETLEQIAAEMREFASSFPEDYHSEMQKWADRIERAAARGGEERLLSAAKKALDEMCNTIAPRNSFTDAVDELDAAITAARAQEPRR